VGVHHLVEEDAVAGLHDLVLRASLQEALARRVPDGRVVARLVEVLRVELLLLLEIAAVRAGAARLLRIVDELERRLLVLLVVGEAGEELAPRVGLQHLRHVLQGEHPPLGRDVGIEIARVEVDVGLAQLDVGHHRDQAVVLLLADAVLLAAVDLQEIVQHEVRVVLGETRGEPVLGPGHLVEEPTEERDRLADLVEHARASGARRMPPSTLGMSRVSARASGRAARKWHSSLRGEVGQRGLLVEEDGRREPLLVEIAGHLEQPDLGLDEERGPAEGEDQRPPERAHRVAVEGLIADGRGAEIDQRDVDPGVDAGQRVPELDEQAGRFLGARQGRGQPPDQNTPPQGFDGDLDRHSFRSPRAASRA